MVTQNWGTSTPTHRAMLRCNPPMEDWFRDWPLRFGEIQVRRLRPAATRLLRFS
jgi:hypothetical protein